MAKKTTTSDLIKQALTQAVGGSAKDWKRISKKKNEDGKWIREFEHKKTGTRLSLIQLSETRIAFYNASTQNKKNNEPTKASPISADEFIDKCLESEIFEEENLDIDAAAKALGKDLASKFVFAYFGKNEEFEEEFVAWYITPLKYWQDEGCVFDMPCPIETLLPNDAEDVNECGTWVWIDNLTPLERAKDLISRGFKWDKNFQDFINDCNRPEDKKAIEAICQLMEKLAKSESDKPKPPAP